MKKYFLFATSLLLTLGMVAQQKLQLQFTVPIPGEGGANSASVVWHPTYKKYYTAIVGNTIYTMASFDSKGKNVKALGETGVDLRGMWYNPTTKRLEFNGYDSTGIGYYTLNKTGDVATPTIVKEGMYQPNHQSVGTYLSSKKRILYLGNLSEVKMYDATTGIKDEKVINLHLGSKKKEEKEMEDDDDYATLDRLDERNKTQLAYTGIAKQEFGLLNTKDKTIELYNMATGYLTKTLVLPKEVIVYESFNFCYNNGYWWLFNKEERAWKAYK